MDDNSVQSSGRQRVSAKEFYQTVDGGGGGPRPAQEGRGNATAAHRLAMSLNNQVAGELLRRHDPRWQDAMVDGWTGRYSEPLGLSKAHISSREFSEWVHLVEQDTGQPVADLQTEYARWVSSRFPAFVNVELQDRREDLWNVRFSVHRFQGGGLVALVKSDPANRFIKGRFGGGIRGKVTGFSAASRGRALREFAKVNWPAVNGKVLCVDLTYPGEYSMQGRDWKRDLDVFDHRFRRKYPLVAFWWKLEPQDRGAPHFHLIVFGVEWIDRQWLSQAWYEVVGSGDVRHLKAGTRVCRVHSRGGVVSYVCGYLTTKDGKNPVPEWWKTASSGRFWGWRGKGNVPIERIVTELPYERWAIFRRLMYRCLRNHMKPKRWRQWWKRLHSRESLLACGWGFIESATVEKMLEYVLLGMSRWDKSETPF